MRGSARRWTRAWGLSSIVACFALACGAGGSEGAGPEGGTDTEASDESGGSDDGAVPQCDVDDPVDVPLRRLTHWEYDNTVRDLLGDDSRPSQAFPTDAAAVGFDNDASGLQVSTLQAEAYLAAAEQLAATAVQDLPALLPCDPTSDGETGCGQAFIETFGARAFRRPLTEAQIDRYASLFTQARADWGFDKAIELVISAMLQSPSFLYRIELSVPAEGEALVTIDDWEMASRLSYFLWGSMPDDVLFQAAAAGELQTPDQIRAQAERMLDDVRATEAVSNFHRQWLRLGDIDLLTKDTALFPSFDDALKASMKTETLTFLQHLVFDDSGDLESMFVADHSYVDAALADLYGVAAPAGSGFARVDLEASQRAGLLTHAGILAATSKPNSSSPVLRGKWVREQILCESLPEPPPDVDTTPPEVDPDATTRERYEQHRSDPTCASCHQLIDPIGFGLEHYDAIGQWRAEESGQPIDATGELVTSAEGTVAFDGAIELAQILAGSETVQDCFVKQWFTYVHGRAPTEADACTLEQLGEDFDAAEHQVKALLLAVTQTDAFRFRGGSP